MQRVSKELYELRILQHDDQRKNSQPSRKQRPCRVLNQHDSGAQILLHAIDNLQVGLRRAINSCWLVADKQLDGSGLSWCHNNHDTLTYHPESSCGYDEKTECQLNHIKAF